MLARRRCLLALRARHIALRTQPEPGLVIDDLDLLSLENVRTELDSIRTRSPLGEMDERTLTRLAVLRGLANHVHTLHLTQSNLLKNALHPLPRDVGKHEWNADAWVLTLRHHRG